MIACRAPAYFRWPEGDRDASEFSDPEIAALKRRLGADRTLLQRGAEPSYLSRRARARISVLRLSEGEEKWLEAG